MTDLQPVTATEPPPALLRSLLGASLPAFGTARVTRMHFPTGRPVQMHLEAEGGALIAEWLGEAAPARAMAEAERLSLAGQDGALRVETSLGLIARAPGQDAKLPALRLTRDAAFAAEVLPGLGLRGPFRIDLVAHRLGKRAVLRIAHAGGTAYARLRAPGATQARLAAARHAMLWQVLGSDRRLRLPEPLGERADLGLTLYRALPGRAPLFRGLRGFVEVEAISRAILALQGAGIDAPRHGVEDEIATLAAWHRRLSPLDPQRAARIGALIHALSEALQALPPMPAVPCHRDLHEGQVVIRAGVAGVMDFDTLRLGDPALDIGNLQAHLVMAGFRQDRSLAAYTTAMERLFPHLPLARIALWRRVALLRLALIHAFTTDGAGLSDALVTAAE